jgi:hypothetical protein
MGARTILPRSNDAATPRPAPAGLTPNFGLTVPTGLGFGIALDEDKVARFRRDR